MGVLLESGQRHDGLGVFAFEQHVGADGQIRNDARIELIELEAHGNLFEKTRAESAGLGDCGDRDYMRRQLEAGIRIKADLGLGIDRSRSAST